jgi:hypothetical protein
MHPPDPAAPLLIPPLPSPGDFSSAPLLVMRQAWLPVPEEVFLPARVWTGQREGALWIKAELEDRDIFNPETVFNAPSFRTGDVLEIFLRPEGQSAYYEYHVTPLNQNFQLRIPSSEAFSANRNLPIPQSWLIPDLRIQSEVAVAGGRWQVTARLPLAPMVEDGRDPLSLTWWLSYSRYDYTRGAAKPVVSSTSPHPVLSFHRQQDWCPIRFR